MFAYLFASVFVSLFVSLFNVSCVSLFVFFVFASVVGSFFAACLGSLLVSVVVPSFVVVFAFACASLFVLVCLLYLCLRVVR